MFVINGDNSIYLTRGDIAPIAVSVLKSNKELYKLQPGDIIRLTVTVKNKCSDVVIQKDVVINDEADVAVIQLTSKDTKIGDIINKPIDYWYDIVLNPDTAPQTIIGYDTLGPKIFRLFPEGDDIDA